MDKKVLRVLRTAPPLSPLPLYPAACCAFKLIGIKPRMCPSFPWLFCFTKENLENDQGFSVPAECTRTLEKTKENT